MKNLYLSTFVLFLSLAVPILVHNASAATPQFSFGSLGSGPGQLNTPRGIAVDDSGNIYVADNRNHRVEEFDSSGKYVSEFDKGGIPEGIAIYNGTIYVVDRNSTSVEEFNFNGILLSSFGSQGTNMGQLSNPERIAIDSLGNIYVADTGDIQKFNSKGNSVAQFLADSKYQCCLNVMGVAVDGSNNVYAADMEFHKIIKFSPTGSTLAEFNATFSAPDISGTPQDVAVDNSGNIYVADTYDGRIVKLDPAGNPISALAISGVPVGLAIKGNQVYVVDIANSRVDMFLESQFVNNYTGVTPTDEQRKEEQLNKNSSVIDTAIKFAESSPQFQSLVEGYNYTFSSDFEESGPLSKGGIGLTAHGFAFDLYSGPVNLGKAVKVVEVMEDPTFTKILNVTSYPAVYEGGPMISSTPAQNSTSVYAQNDVTLGVNTGKGYIVITGSVYKLFSYPVVLKIQSPNGTLIAVSQLKPSSDGAFSLNISPSAPLWSTQGNYTVTISSDSQEIGKTTFYFNGTNLSSVSHGINTMGRLSPLEQLKTGTVAGDVKCNVGLQLLFKAEDDSPACVKLDTAYALIKRGWAVSESVYPEGNPQFAQYTNSTIIPGHLPRSSGLMLPYSESHRIVNYTGFVGVYNETLLYHGTQEDYVLRQGNTGTITFEIDAQATELPGQSYPTPLPKSLNLTNYAIFYHEITSLEELAKYPGVTFGGNHDFKACSTGPGGGGACIGGKSNGQGPIEAYVTDHPGVNVLFEPPLEVLPLGTHTTSQTVTMTITADSDASKGTYLVELSPFGLGTFLLTVGNQPYHE